jgi:hypothetical protein
MQSKLNITITEENLSNWFCGALEGGSNYWYLLNDINRKDFIKGEPLTENLAKSFMANPNYKLNVYDIESDEDELDLLGAVTWDNIKFALVEMHKNYQDLYHDLVHGDADADSCDVWFQLATMKDVVFG